MNNKKIIIVLGEPYSTFNEIFFKFFKRIKKKNKNKIVLIGSKKLLEKHMLRLKFKFKINEVDQEIFLKKVDKNTINIINVKFNFKKIFDKISYKSKSYINKCFKIALNLILNKKADYLINGPISKKYFLNKKYPGITEFLGSKTNSKLDPVMLIYNKNLSVSPITTHIPIKKVNSKISKKKIIHNVMQINKFFKDYFNFKASFAVLGLNPHCETTNKISEESSIIIPAIKHLKKKKINISGPFSADTFFLKKNIKKVDVVIGMYHDQVLTPLKTIYKFDAINITLGLPFLRISPDHGTNNEMLGKGRSDPTSLISAYDFIRKVKK